MNETRIHEISDGAGYVRVTESKQEEQGRDCPPCLSIRVGFHDDGDRDYNEVTVFREDAEFLLGVLTGWLATTGESK